MERRNSFEELEAETIRRYGSPPGEISNNIRRNIRVFHLFGDLIDLFFPKVLRMFASMASGSSDQHNSKDHRTQNHSKPPNISNENL